MQRTEERKAEIRPQQDYDFKRLGQSQLHLLSHVEMGLMQAERSA